MSLAQRVDNIMLDCLHGQEEGALRVEGLVRTFCLDPERVQAHREEIREILNLMDPAFHVGGGGGMSFLNLPVDMDGNQWGEQLNAEALLALGLAAGMAKIPIPRDMWGLLPGGVPYVCFDTTKE